MSASAAYTFSVNQLQPLYHPRRADEIAVALAPGIYARGTVLGQITGSNVADVQTVTITGSPTGGTWNLSGLPGGGNLTGIAQAVTLAVLQAALNAIVGAGGYVVTGTPGSSYVLTAGGPLANQPLAVLGVSHAFSGGTSPNLSISAHTVGVGPNGTYAAYASGNTDGSQVPTGILRYPVTVNNAGQIVLSDLTGVTELVTPMFYKGAFASQDCTGLDANALTKLGGHLISGTVTTGSFVF